MKNTTLAKILVGLFTVIIGPIIVALLTREGGPLNPKETPTPNPTAAVVASPTPVPGPKVLEIRILDVKASLVSNEFGSIRPMKQKLSSLPNPNLEILGAVTDLQWNLEYSIINDGNESGQGCILRLSQLVTKPRVTSETFRVTLIEGQEDGNISNSNQFGIPSMKQLLAVPMKYTAEMIHSEVYFGLLTPTNRIYPKTEDVDYSATVKAVVSCRNGQTAPFDQELSVHRGQSFADLATAVASPSPSPSPSSLSGSPIPKR